MRVTLGDAGNTRNVHGMRHTDTTTSHTSVTPRHHFLYPVLVSALHLHPSPYHHVCKAHVWCDPPRSRTWR